MASALDYCPSSYNDCTAVLPDLTALACKGVGVDLIDRIYFTEANAPGFSATEYATPTSRATAWAARLAQTLT